MNDSFKGDYDKETYRSTPFRQLPNIVRAVTVQVASDVDVLAFAILYCFEWQPEDRPASRHSPPSTRP